MGFISHFLPRPSFLPVWRPVSPSMCACGVTPTVNGWIDGRMDFFMRATRAAACWLISLVCALRCGRLSHSWLMWSFLNSYAFSLALCFPPHFLPLCCHPFVDLSRFFSVCIYSYVYVYIFFLSDFCVSRFFGGFGFVSGFEIFSSFFSYAVVLPSLQCFFFSSSIALGFFTFSIHTWIMAESYRFVFGGTLGTIFCFFGFSGFLVLRSIYFTRRFFIDVFVRLFLAFLRICGILGVLRLFFFFYEQYVFAPTFIVVIV